MLDLTGGRGTAGEQGWLGEGRAISPPLSQSAASAVTLRRGSERPQVITRLEEEWDLNPGPLTPDPDFLRIGRLTACFPFAASSHTASAVVMASGGPCGDRPRGSAHWATVLLAQTHLTGAETEKRHRESLTRTLRGPRPAFSQRGTASGRASLSAGFLP